MTLLSTLLVAASLAFTAEDASRTLDLARELVTKCPNRDAGSVPGMIAANWILDTASERGLNVRRDRFRAATPNGDRSFVNLSAEFRFCDTGKWVVVTSHYDTKGGVKCPGANDGASTTALLITLGECLQRRDVLFGNNVLFLWLDGEECVKAYGPDDGLHGSRRAAAELKRRGLDVRAVLCLDMLGDRDLSVTLPANGDRALSAIAVHAARIAQWPAGTVRQIDECVTDDHVPFADQGYAAIDLIDFSYGPDNSWWHTAEDTPDKLSAESFEKSGRLVATLLELLLK